MSVGMKALVKEFLEARETFSRLGSMVPFSDWYKGDHGKLRKEVLRTSGEILKLLKGSSEPEDKILLAKLKDWRDAFSMKETPRDNGLTALLKARTASKTKLSTILTEEGLIRAS